MPAMKKKVDIVVLANTRLGYWRTVHSPILTRALTKAFLKNEGLISLSEITNPLLNC
jgi:hypothetical protein